MCTVDKVGFARSQLTRSGSSVKELLLKIIWKQSIKQFGAGTLGVVHRRDERLSLHLKKKGTLLFEEPSTFRDKHVEKVIVELREADLLSTKDAGDKRCQVCFADDVDLRRFSELELRGREERFLG